MKIKFIALLTLLLSTSLHAQNDDKEAIHINGVPIMLSELKESYNAGEIQDLKTFVDGFVSYKLFVEEAKNQKIDTTFNFRKDYSTYRIQLSRKYQDQSLAREPVTQKVYNHLLEELDINQYFFPFENKILFPSDTLALYNKALKKRKKLSASKFEGKGWIDHAKATNVLPDRSVLTGHLGWMATLSLPASVENVAYELAVGEISQPIRSSKGYHILQVVNKEKSRGLLDVEQVSFDFYHIPPRKQDIDSVRKVVDEVYKTLKNDKESYAELCAMYRSAKGTTDDDCSFGVFGRNAFLSPSMVNGIFSLKNVGDVSEPILSDYGFHIYRLKNVIAHPSMEEASNVLFSQVLKSSYEKEFVSAYLNEKKELLDIRVNELTLNKLTEATKTLYPLEDKFISQFEDDNETLYNIDNGGKVVSVADFVKSLRRTYVWYEERLSAVGSEEPVLSTDKLHEYLNDFLAKEIEIYADATLERRHPEMKKLLDKYTEGILLFELKKRHIWQVAKRDKNGLENFYKRNKSKIDKMPNSTLEDMRSETEILFQQHLEDEYTTKLKSKYSVDINWDIVNTLK